MERYDLTYRISTTGTWFIDYGLSYERVSVSWKAPSKVVFFSLKNLALGNCIHFTFTVITLTTQRNMWLCFWRQAWCKLCDFLAVSTKSCGLNYWFTQITWRDEKTLDEKQMCIKSVCICEFGMQYKKKKSPPQTKMPFYLLWMDYFCLHELLIHSSVILPSFMSWTVNCPISVLSSNLEELLWDNIALAK